jgi:hypothetical protein
VPPRWGAFIYFSVPTFPARIPPQHAKTARAGDRGPAAQGSGLSRRFFFTALKGRSFTEPAALVFFITLVRWFTRRSSFGSYRKPERNPQGLKPRNLWQSTAGINACSTPLWSTFTLKMLSSFMVVVSQNFAGEGACAP